MCLCVCVCPSIHLSICLFMCLCLYVCGGQRELVFSCHVNPVVLRLGIPLGSLSGLQYYLLNEFISALNTCKGGEVLLLLRLGWAQEYENSVQRLTEEKVLRGAKSQKSQKAKAWVVTCWEKDKRSHERGTNQGAEVVRILLSSLGWNQVTEVRGDQV